MLKKIVFSILLVGLLFNTVFSETKKPTKKEKAKLGKLMPTKELIMGVVPAEDPTVMMERQKPLVEYLSNVLKRPIKTFIATDYTGVVEAMRAGKVHFAWFGPFSYVMAAERADAVPLAVPIKDDGRSVYRSYITTSAEIAKNLGITEPLRGEEGMKKLVEKLQPFKKKYTLTFTDPASTSGYAVPRFFMHKAGIKPEDLFKKIGYIGAHDAGQLAVKHKILDFAACWDKTYEDMLRDGKIDTNSNMLIWISDEIPESPIAYRRDLPKDILEPLKEAIVNMPENIARIQGSTYKGYRLVKEEDFKVIVEIKQVLDNL
ncbi:MAG: phosphate/phosphite/phosphonate ABC transporter substrate-binding protein [Brevinematales bacterium]|nr:phosphate/phosphite/phosphonate ABC transporter substrate-binding protein [Brevinematales bacterium]